MRLLFVVFVISLFYSFTEIRIERKDKLSDYGFFQGRLADLSPAPGVIPYDLNTPLFSNYAEKSRFIRLPEGGIIAYDEKQIMSFPTGTILIKNFYYPNDFRKSEKGRKIIETRLLINGENGWEAFPYIWNDEQTEAFYDPAGETKDVTYVSSSGKKTSTHYVVPNKNQCKGCHTRDDKMQPIGPSARQLNRVTPYSHGKPQLQWWQELGILNRLPQDAPKLAVWNDPSTGNLNDRARAYLDANCAHCHSSAGPASTSGLFLDIYETNPSRLGVNKPPVAAGRGAGDNQFDIKPGEPSKSIMVFRMNTTDPAIAMPEIGREQIHNEGVELIAEWIRKNTFVSK